MQTRLSIGDFSRMTHLSVKALRHYHDQGLLEPVDVDRQSGYRFYAIDQVPTAQVIRRFRALGMPVGTIKAVIDAPDLARRNEIIVDHLNHMERQLEQTQLSVAALRAILEPAPAAVSVEFRLVPQTRVAAIAEHVRLETLGTWMTDALAELRAGIHTAGHMSDGPAGGLYPTELFTDEAGDCIVYVPCSADLAPSGRVRIMELPAAEYAVALHRGSHDTADQTYGALGTLVAERALGVEGPIREHYLVTMDDTADAAAMRTEICWPIFRTA